MNNKLDIKKHSPEVIMKQFRKIKTINDCIVSGQKTLSSIRKEKDYEYSVKYLSLWLISLNEYLNVSRKMSAEQIQETASYIYDEYHYFNIADVYLVFTKIKKGEFGDLYESIDGVKVLKFFKMYAEQRANIFEEMNIKQSDNKKYQDEKIGFKRISPNKKI